jgi:uncharacterized repeat protein (TIGR03803 family)
MDAVESLVLTSKNPKRRFETVRKEWKNSRDDRLNEMIMANPPKHLVGIPTIALRWICSRMALVLLALNAVTIQPAPAYGQSPPRPTYSETVLFSFAGGADGASPAGGLRRDNANNLYGTTNTGGDLKCGQRNAGCGTVFKVASNGNLTVLHTFRGSSDGDWPVAGLVFDPAKRNLYGTTSSGGAGSGCDGGCGVVFKIGINGNETILHSFAGGSSDGAYPSADLIVDANDNVYGTTIVGGSYSRGVVFKIDSSGNETVLHSFAGKINDDGAVPWGAVILDSAGNLYGTTTEGGTYDQGAVFKVDISGNETVLYSFNGGSTDGCDPSGNLVMDASNNIYGTGQWCGADDSGVVWKLTSDGVETLLHSFTGQADGQSPYGGMIIDPQGNLYGTTQFGGIHGWGTIFEVNSSGKTIVLHTFGRGTDGQDPEGGLIRDQQGNLYGTTAFGGNKGGFGTVFKIAR